jgi:hypothetical protein
MYILTAHYLGSIVNSALYGLGMRVETVNTLFKELSKRVFRGRNRLGVSFAAAAHALVASYRRGRFPAADIDGPLQEIFGNLTVLDHPYMTSIGARTGFPVVSLDTSDTYIVTSYNGVGNSQVQDNGSKQEAWDCMGRLTGSDFGGDEVFYKILRSNGPHDDILVKDGQVLLHAC